jgi:hypothetical protein
MNLKAVLLGRARGRSEKSIGKNMSKVPCKDLQK